MKKTGLLFVFFLFMTPIVSSSIYDSGLNNYYELIIKHSEVRTHETAVQDLWFFDNREAVQEYCEIVLSPVFSNDSALNPGDVVILNLFEDFSYGAVIERVSMNINGTLSIRGKLDDYDFAYFFLSNTDNLTLVNIDIPETGKYFMITSPLDSMKHYLFRLNRPYMDIIEDKYQLEVPKKPEGSIKEGSFHLPRNDEITNIDVLIVYTPAAFDWAVNNVTGISNVISQAMQSSQLVLDNSDTLITLNLVFSALVNYVEHGNSRVDLIRLTAHSGFNPWGDYYEDAYIPGFMDEVHYWRDIYGVDLVSLLTMVQDVGGLGWLLEYAEGYPELGFSLTRVQQAHSTYTFIHELGHNMGAHHHKDQSVGPGPTIWEDWPENVWSAGWRWTGSDQQHYCSVMSYESGQYYDDNVTHSRVPYFSNPNISLSGFPTGHPVDGDNARTIREVRNVIADYRSISGSDYIQIGSGSTVNQPSEAAPVNVYYKSLRGQMVYTRSEINNGGFSGPGSIDAIAFFIEGSPAYSLPDFTIRMRHTSATDASSHIGGPYETVYYTSNYSPSEGQWEIITLNTAFNWNGTDNILIDTAFSIAEGWSLTGQQRVFGQSNGFRYTRSDSSDQTNVETQYTAAYKPQIRLYFGGVAPPQFPPPANLTANPGNSVVHLHWNAPSGNVSPIGYNIYRNGNLVNSNPVTSTNYSDNGVTNGITYSFFVTALYSGGESGPSNVVQATPSGYVVLFSEEFTGVSVGSIPQGWQTTNSNWGAVNTNYAGGTVPEMRFYWSPQVEGLLRLTTPQISLIGYSNLVLSFKQAVDDWSNPPGGYELLVQTSSDGQNWSTIWSIEPSSDIPSETVEISINNFPESNIYISWVYNGDSYDINEWNIDDVFLTASASIDNTEKINYHTVIKGNYPNPFNPSTEILYSISQPGNVVLEVYNIKGQRVRTILSGYLQSGVHRVVWDGTNGYGKSVSSGVYFIKMSTEETQFIHKTLLMK